MTPLSFAHRGLLTLIAAIGLMHVPAGHAGTTPDSRIDCSGTLGVTSPTPGALTFTCSDALTLTGGGLSAAGVLTLKAGSTLTLIDVALHAPAVELVAGSGVTIDSRSRIDLTSPAGAVVQAGSPLDGGSISLDGGSLAIASLEHRSAPLMSGVLDVPEPASGLLLLIGGVGAVASLHRRRLAGAA